MSNHPESTSEKHDGSPASATDSIDNKGRSRSVHAIAAKGRLFRGLGGWAFEHKWEIFWGLLFAWVMARFVFPPPHDPYYIQVIERSKDDPNDDVTVKRLHQLAEQKWTLGDVPIELKIVQLQEHTDSDRQKEEAKQVAETLAHAKDTLIVIGDVPTGLTKQSLPIYMGAKPPVPYLSTTASADGLCQQCPATPFRPLLQVSPMNSNEAFSMLLWARQNQKSRCLVVTDQSPAAVDYATELANDLSNASSDALKDVSVVHEYRIGNGPPPSEEEFQAWKADCVLFAGNAGAASTLWNLIRGRNMLTVFSDGVVNSHGGRGITDLGSSYFTYAADVADVQNTVYVDDAVEIATSLLQDLNRKGGNISYRLRSLLHVENVESARDNLARIMEENSKNRTYYHCSSNPDGLCIFSGNQRANGLFHVWQQDGKMKDVDGWHQPRHSVK